MKGTVFEVTVKNAFIIPNINNERPKKQGAKPQLDLKILQFLKIKKEAALSEIAKALGHKTLSGELKKQLLNLLKQKRIERTIPEKPRSSLQKYRLTRPKS